MEISTHGPLDALQPDGVYAAIFAAEQATAFRRLLSRRFAVMALAAWLLEMFTLLPSVGVAIALRLFGAGAAAAFIAEQRAHTRLRSLLDVRGR